MRVTCRAGTAPGRRPGRADASTPVALPWLLALLVAPACRPDHSLPEAVEISCARHGECPTGYDCRPAVGRCVPVDHPDREPPQLAEAALLVPAQGTRDTVFTLEFRVTEALAEDPAVLADLGQRSVPFSLDERATDRTTGTYACTYRATGTEPEGAVPVTAGLLDRAGNLAPDLALGSFRLDFSAPRVVDVSFGAELANAETVLALDVAFDEPLAEAPHVEMVPRRQPGPSFAWRPGTGDGRRFSSSYLPTGVEPPERYGVVVSGRDVAGNLLAPTEVGEVGLDFDAPAVVSVDCEPRHVAPGDVVVAVVRLDGAPAGPPRLAASAADGAELAFELAEGWGELLSFRHVVLAGEEGTYELRLSGVQDAAGNRAEPRQLGELVVDETPPRVLDLTQQAPSREGDGAYNASDVLVLGFSTDEPLGEPPHVSLGPVPVPCEDAAGLQVRCTLALAETRLSGTLPITVRLVDEVGNRVEADVSYAEVDALPPSLVDVAVEPRVARLGAVVRLSALVSEPLRSPPELHWHPGESPPPTFTPAGVSGLTHAFQLVVDAAIPAGEHRLARVVLLDAAGNTSTHDVAPADGTYEVDNAPPAVSELQTNADAYSRQAGFDQVAVTCLVSEPLDRPGARLEVRFGDEDMDCGPYEDPPGRYTCLHTVGERDEEGPVAVTILAVDAAGNSDHAGTTVRLDLSPPTVIADTVTVQLEPAPGSPVPRVSAVTQGTRVRVGFSVDEPLLDAPEVVSSVNGLVFEPEVRSGTYYVLGHALADTEVLQGEERLVFSLRDRVGNSGRQELREAGFRIDTRPPAAPLTGEVGKVVLVRKPWGDAEQPARLLLGVEGLPGATEGPGTLLAFDGPGPDRSELGRIETTPDGGVPWLDLRAPDRREVHVAFADPAGNLSPAERVLDVEWLASLGLKRPGEDHPNPHVFSSRPIWQDHLLGADGSFGTEPDSEPLLLPGDGSELRTLGGGAWRQEQVGRRVAQVEVAREGLGMAYDSARGRLVLFGGIAVDRMDDTWEWDGRDWLERSPAHRPAPRTGHGLAYDSGRGRTLLFGGRGALGRLSDLWEWDGVDWVFVAADPGPAPRTRHAMAFDGTRDRLVRFGGTSPGDELLGDTWEWDGARWHQREPELAPSPRHGHAMTHDVARGRVVLFGGRSRGSQDETWEWNGSDWTRMDPAHAPPAREGHALAFDARRDRVVLFGGFGIPAPLDDTWEWDGEDWRQREPDVSPPPRGGHAMAHHAGLGRVLLAGGRAGGLQADLWTWDGESWHRLSSLGLPVPRQLPAMAFDGVGERVILYGGWGTRGTRFDTLWWDGNSWRPVAASTQPRVNGARAVHDARRDRVVLFGRNEEGGPSMWEFDGEDWLPVEADPAPSPRYEHAMAYDQARGRTVLFGGRFPGLLGDTWEWDGAVWRQAAPEEAPSARKGAAMAYCGARGRVVLFGGDAGEPRDDLWEWDGESWNPVVTAVQPPPRAHAVFASTPPRGPILLTGGRSGDLFWDDAFEFDGHDFRQLVVSPRPPFRSRAGASYDLRRERLVLFGGRGVIGSLNDTWEWDGVDWRQAGRDYGPSAREGGAMAYDPGSDMVLLFGGHDGFGMQAVPWAWDGRLWHELLPDTLPPRRMDHVLAIDPQREAVVLTGGWGPGGNRLDDTWVSEGHEWLRLRPPETPDGRSGAAGALDSDRGRLVLFGGRGRSGGSLADTWEWDGGSWVRPDPATSPAARHEHALAYHPDRRRVVLFGGRVGGDQAADTWEWDGESWEERFPDPRPPAREKHALVLDPIRRTVVLFGGLGEQSYLGDTWEWDGERWWELGPEVRPPPRGNHALAFDEAGGGIVLFGGEHDDVLLGDTWTLASSTEDRPGHRFAVDVRSALHSQDVEPVSLSTTFHAGGTGVVAADPVSGVDLLAWSSVRGRWLNVASNDAGVTVDDPPAPIVWTSESPAEIRSLLFRDHLHFAVIPVGSNGAGRAELVSDCVEVTLRYRLP